MFCFTTKTCQICNNKHTDKLNHCKTEFSVSREVTRNNKE